jgi:electron transfer flavoprotein beta subunit
MVKILVSVKRVPDPETKIKLAADGQDIARDGVKFVINPFDEIAVEEALRIQEKQGGEVVVVSIGGPEVVEQIRTALAMGAERGIHVNTTEKVDSDVAARILAAVAKQESPDLILMGKQAIDDDANQTGQILATLLEMPQACFAFKVAVEGREATVQREVDGGIETVKVALPAVVTADLRLNEPRYASLPGIMKAKRKEVKEVTPDALGVAVAPKVKILKLETPPARGGTKKLDSVDALLQALRTEAKVF